MRIFGSNTTITASALLLLLLLLPFRDSIPVNQGLGYDGARYASWVRTFSLSSLGIGFASTADPVGEPLVLDSYQVRRILPSAAVHYGLRALGLSRTAENVIAAFTVANILLVTLTVFWWCCAADELSMGIGAKWLGFLALAVNYSNWKLPLFYPVLTDVFALAFGAAGLLLFLRRRQVALMLLTMAGAFVWPTILFFNVLLLVFPRTDFAEVHPSPHRWNVWAAAGTALGSLVLINFFGRSADFGRTSSVFAASLSALYLFFGLRSLLNSRDFWQSIHPMKVLRTPWFWGAALLLVAVTLAAESVAVGPSRHTAGAFLKHTLLTGIKWPGIFLLSHVLYYGPLVLFLFFLWPSVSRDIARQGSGMILCFALALFMSLGSESRQLMNFYPVVVLFLAQALDDIALRARGYAVLAILSLIFSKVWLPMGRDLSIPLLGEVHWRTLYVSSRGPYMEEPWYFVQGVGVSILAVAFYFLWVRNRESGANP